MARLRGMSIAPLSRALVGALLSAGLLGAQTYEHRAPLAPGDDAATILAKAARVVPNRPQRLHHAAGFVGFVHFGPNTFTGVEWGDGLEDPAVFDPGETLDTDQWCEAMQAAGMTRVILTVKHHDGFCLWQTRYNATHSVRATPWRDGQGDVLRELADSARRHGLQLGVYLSPADLFQIESADGLYGNLSTRRPTVIPTDPDRFADDPTVARADRPAGAPTFELELDDYNRYFMNQLYELLTEYGPIHEVWFDGAHPKRKGGQTYDKPAWFAMIRELAPDAAIFGGPDARWCGNESGVTRAAEWSVLPVQDLAVVGEDRPADDIGSDAMVVRPTYDVYGTTYEARALQYLVCEVDTSLRAGWFWRDETQAVRTPDDVFDIWERSVGGNAVFLLNVPPDRTGRFAEGDVACLREVGRRIGATYGEDLLAGAAVEDEHGAAVDGLRDGDLGTAWQAPGEQASMVVRLPVARPLNRFVIQEDVSGTGQRVAVHALDARVDGEWLEVARAETIGYRRILRFDQVQTDALRLRVLASRAPPALAELSAHLDVAPPGDVGVGRDGRGFVHLASLRPDHVFAWKHLDSRQPIPHDEAAMAIHYTLDGSEPTADSPRYDEPLHLPDGGLLKARGLVDGRLGSVSEAWLPYWPTDDWRVSDHHGERRARVACDGNDAVNWLFDRFPTILSIAPVRKPRSIALAGIVYHPPTARGHAVTRARVQVGEDFLLMKTVAEVTFGNIANDPSPRVVLFDEVVQASAVRFVALEGESPSGGGAAEISLLPPRGGDL